MRYISHYEEYPIYEPAEGGYYYSGNQLVTTERKSKRACKKELLKIWERCKQENIECGFREDNKDEWDMIRRNTHIYILGILIVNATTFTEEVIILVKVKVI